MIIFFGIKNIRSTNTICQTTCPCCKQDTALVVQTYTTNFHVFWMAMFPMAKKFVTVCTSCKATIPPFQYDAKLSQTLTDALSRTKFTWKNFLFPIVILTLVVGTTIYGWATEGSRKEEQDKAKKKAEEAFQENLKNPSVNDIYVVHAYDTTLEGTKYRVNYALMVDNVTPDSLTFIPYKENLVRKSVAKGFLALGKIESDRRFYNTEKPITLSRKGIAERKELIVFKIENIISE